MITERMQKRLLAQALIDGLLESTGSTSRAGRGRGVRSCWPASATRRGFVVGGGWL